MRPEPIGDDELDGLFGGAAWTTLVLAVSGGADSRALMQLAVRWRQRLAIDRPAPSIHVATVDHGLRAESAREAAWVGGEAASLGLAHAILSWAGPKPVSALQAEARLARYHLLGLHCRDLGAALVTAHTLDDQAETLLMRLARGSGLDGLAGMRPVEKLGSMIGVAAWEAGTAGVPVWRPLLGIAKSRLTATLEAEGLGWLEDPSNENMAFERVRIRRAGHALAELGLTNAALAATSRRLDRARDALVAEVDDLWSKVVDLHDGACATIRRDTLALLSGEFRVRILARALQAFGGDVEHVPLAKAEALADWVASGAAGGRTLAGCRIEADGAAIVVWREVGRKGIADLALAAGGMGVWDGRFLAEAPAAGPGWLVSAFDPSRLPEEAKVLVAAGELPPAVAVTLPAVIAKENGHVAAVPHLGYEAPYFRMARERGHALKLNFLWSP